MELPRRGEDTNFTLNAMYAHYQEGWDKDNLILSPDSICYYRQFDKQITRNPKLRIVLFEHCIKTVTEFMPKLEEIGLKYSLLGKLFLTRYNLYKERELNENKIKGIFLNLQAKTLSLASITLALAPNF